VWSVWSRRSARQYPSGRWPSSSRPYRPCAGLISSRPWESWLRPVIFPDFKTRARLWAIWALCPRKALRGTRSSAAVTKAGNARARRMLVEAAWSYRYPPRVSQEKQRKVAAAPRRVREIAWKAQTRLCGRFRSLVRKGKRPTIVATAIARELSAFIWAINHEIMGNRQAFANLWWRRR
jgi:hypothetical protein